ncbi:GumC family protein [Pontibacter cellulosilyticus]|uniref:non-specific protein-tyrosine kinase n=1 Tax=Pontibacter cellulosilyticus TaxID=1720253 RepID=A0A923N1M9_9BACT|nr:polysaccharide biosynthesis tyrosine autokinase [Pontibacter cellulosilyticus]MBC5991215.1 polysaccharide biosynthesis tyrosine autokinase [Pontibacter cellulosilyticus]
MKKANKEHEIDLRSWLFKFRSRWYLFAGFTLLALAVAYVYVKSSERIYAFHSTLLLGDQQTGSKKAQELLELLHVQDKGIKVEDEIGLLKSADMIKSALQRLDFSTSYYKVPDHWLNSGFDLIKQEQFETTPYIVELDTSGIQLVDVPFEVKVLNDKEYELTVEGENVPRYNFNRHEVLGYVPYISFTKVLKFGEPYTDENISFTLRRNKKGAGEPPAKKHYFVLNSLESQVGQRLATLNIDPIERDSRVLELSTKGTIPDKEMLFLNTLMDVYVARDLEEKNTNGRKTLEFIDSQIATLTDSLKQSKQALSSFRSANRISNIDAQANSTYERLSQLEIDKAKLSTDRQYYAAILEEIENNQGFTEAVSPAVAGVQNPILANLFLELSDLNKQKAGYKTSATQINPMLKEVDGKIASIRSAIIANLKNLISSADIAIRETEKRITTLETTLAKQPEHERRLADLKGQADFIDKKYEFLQEKRAEAAISLATNTTDKKIVDRASFWGNGPVNVKPNMIYLLALLLGLAIPAGLIVLIDNVDNTIQGKNDISSITNIPFLGVIAHGSKSDKLAVKTNPKSAIAESFRSIRINLQYLLSSTNFKVVGITSSISGEGKTFCSVNLSHEFALSGKRTILIESDMRKPTFGKYFNVSSEVGLSTYLNQDMIADEVIQKTDIENLDIIPCGPIPENAIHLLELPRMNKLIEELRGKYDFIVIDTPPIGYVSEFFVLMKHMDTNIYVVKHKYTNKELLNQVNELYAAKKIKNIHIIINDLNFDKTYEYGYKRKASYYYV